jgi:MSHA biogenesis protein MshI
VVPDEESVRFAVGQPADGGKPRILSYGEKPNQSRPGALAAALRGFGLKGAHDGATLLAEGEYEFLVADAPDVQDAELRGAMKWRLKDLVDFPVDQASLDLLVIPGPSGPDSRSRSVFAVLAKNDILRRRVADLDQARFELSVVDIPETAQRNIASLYEEEGFGVALLFFDATGGLMTISSGGELYHVRRLEPTQRNIEEASGRAREDLFGRILLEVHRTLDNFERQFSFVTLTRLLLGPEAQDSGLVEYLRANLTIRVDAVELESVLDFVPEAVPAKREQWRFFHVFGCAIREGAGAR